MPSPTNPGDRAKASRLRKARKLEPVDALWLAEYDETAEKRHKDRKAKRAKDFGASRSGRKVSATFDLDESHEAIGTGTAAGLAAAAALEAKEEGRRLDSLTIQAVDCLKEAVNTYRMICRTLLNRTEVLERTHVELRKSESAHYLRGVELEGALTALQSEKSDDVANQLLLQLISKRFGGPANGSPTGKRKGVDTTGG